MTVSVLIPAYNASSTIAKTLDSLRAQTRKADEIVVCDDGSADDLAAALKDYPEVRLVHQAHAGLSAARNTLLDNAKCDVVMFTDADDLPRPGWIEVLVGRLEKTGADISIGGLWAGEKLDEKRYTYPVEGKGEGVIDGRDYYELQLRHPRGIFSYLPTIAMRREQLMEEPKVRGVVGLQALEDEAFLAQVAKRVRKVAFTEECLYDYISVSSSLCATYMRKVVPSARLRYQWSMKDLSKYRTSGRPKFFLKFLHNRLRAYLQHILKGESLR